jgi:beta-alanine degradation protein BauB
MLAQDLVTVAPQAAKVEFENAKVRVVRLKLAPNESLPLHDRPARVVIPLTNNNVRITRADGSSSIVQSPAGKAAWSEPTRRSVTNLDAPLENVVIELKQAKAPAKALSAPPSPRPENYLEEPLHRWQFENQYVRVYDVRIPPGAASEFHVHGYDTLFIQIAGDMMAHQDKGAEWEKPGKIQVGAVSFNADLGHVRVHRVRNESKIEYHVIAVQLLP